MIHLADLTVGERVVGPDTSHPGTVIEIAFSQVKIEWDRGVTSYFRVDRFGRLRQLDRSPSDQGPSSPG